MNDRPGTWRWTLGLLAASAAVGALVAVWLARSGVAPPAPDEPFPVPPYSATRFRNTGPTAQYIGVAACAACHRANHQSYLLTAHSKALADVVPDAEPPDSSFHHAPSKRSYRVYRQGQQLRHEETVQTVEGKEIARVDAPVRYVMGSGHYARSYLVEIDGFLHESPITWYAAQKAWGMSPGYDAPAHLGFERAADGACLICHAGRFELSGTFHSVTVLEKAIGCESCHGPGSLHQDLRRARTLGPGEDDLTIVNPAKLPRPLQEALCSACHLNGPASIRLRGRQLGDYRPGTPMTDHRIDYRYDAGNEQMTVVGHIEQLRRSVCCQKSEELTCITCHDPHARQKPPDPTAFYRQKCLSCHTAVACRLPPSERLKTADNCLTCHMPRGDTEIPHLVFTHHRIGRHVAAAPEAARGAPELVPTEDVSHLTPLERQRNLGLAYLRIIQRASPEAAAHAAVFRERARTLLEGVHADGLHEGDILAALAELYWGSNRELAHAYAHQAIEAKGIAAEPRTHALYIVAASEMQEREFAAAAGHWEELVKLRRFADDWRLLGMAYLELDQPKQSLAALQQALAIRPYRHTTHVGLSEAYRKQGDIPRAQQHLATARWLHQNRQD